jgi:hypothetical protein
MNTAIRPVAQVRCLDMEGASQADRRFFDGIEVAGRARAVAQITTERVNTWQYFAFDGPVRASHVWLLVQSKHGETYVEIADMQLWRNAYCFE